MAEFPPPPTTSNGEPKGPPQACLFVANLPSSSPSSSTTYPSTSLSSSSTSYPSSTSLSSLSPSSSSEVSEERIREHFAQFGEVLKVKLIKDRSSRPYAFVQFCEVEDASEALKSNRLFEGKRLRVERAKVNRTLFIAKLSRNTTNSALREQAQKFGPVESVTIIKNHQTNRSKGCGFVKYTYREDAMDAFVGLKNVNHKWVVEWATSTNDPDTLGVDKYNIFLGGLNPDEVTKEGIEARFAEYGEIESVSLINKDENEEDTGSPPGARSAFAFVRFTDPSSSAAAIESENGAEWLGRRIRVQYCESAEMKNKRRQTKYAQQPYAPPPPVPAPPPHQFYNTHGPTQPLEPPRPPMMMMGGLPMYNIPPTAAQPTVGAPKATYGTRGKVGETVYPGLATGYPLNPALLAYAQQPWLFAQLQQQLPQQQQPQQQQQQQQPHHLHAPPLHHMLPGQGMHPNRPLHSFQHPLHPHPSHHVQHSSHPHHTLQHQPQHSSQHSQQQQHQQQQQQQQQNQQNQQQNQQNQNQQQQQNTHHHNSSTSHSTGRPLQSLQRNRGEGSTSPNSDDSIGLDGDGGLTQSIAGWVLK